MEEVRALFDITDVKVLEFPSLSSGFGELVPIEFGRLPFAPSRAFSVAGVPLGRERGLHAHRLCHQLLFALSGEIKVLVNDGAAAREFSLRNPEEGLHIPPLIWASQEYLLPDSRLYVLASHPYSREDYIEDFEEFTSERARLQVRNS